MSLRIRAASILKLASPFLATAAAVCALTAPSAASAQIQISHSPTISPALGSMIRGSTATSFTIGTNGSVTQTGGNGVRVHSGGVTPPTITISCGFLNLSGLCALRQIRVTIQPVANSNAQITKFTVGSVQGNILWAIGSPPTPASSMTFDLKPLGLLGTGSFTLGMDVLTAGNLPSGNYNFDYIVTAAFI
ncbi:hypothetical protein ACETK8_08830 [Brevundimonas staleyi]|uniref:DUF4402 domain-containing protein n=1 Tax=Brevundimonas staleyi TaxID=74326 RepID=A0ABW0FN98_9CAUL